MKKKIVIKIKDGITNIEMEGFTGASCTDALEKYVAPALTEGGDIEETESFYNEVSSEEAAAYGYNI